LFDEAISLLCIKPLYTPFCQDRCPPFKTVFTAAWDTTKP
jgi:hypothetical protein